jgi:hypothetical protein
VFFMRIVRRSPVGQLLGSSMLTTTCVNSCRKACFSCLFQLGITTTVGGNVATLSLVVGKEELITKQQVVSQGQHCSYCHNAASQQIFNLPLHHRQPAVD